MTKDKTAVVVLAAGEGTRMKSALPKVMHPLAGRPMIAHLMATVDALNPDRVAVVVGPGMETVARAVVPHPTVEQSQRLGTGHAVAQALPLLDGFTGTVLVLYGDTPLITEDTLDRIFEARRDETDPAVVVLGFTPEDPGDYGRLMLDEDGSLGAIVEAKDATPEQAENDLCNSGVMAFDGSLLAELLDGLDNDNAKGEFYLTDAVGLARAAGRTCAVVEGEPEELLGINSRAELAQAEMIVQDELRGWAMDDGATLLDPTTVYFSFDTRLGRDVTVGPNVIFGPGVIVSDEAEIKAFSHLEGARVRSKATVGPFARLRPGADVGEGARVGNYVEIKNAVIEGGAKVNHLSYVGDARIGEGANVGAGTITCNYDGFAKGKTDIGKGAFIGSNTALVAPVTVGEGAIVGAGSVITHDVEADALAVTRAKQQSVDGGAASFRKRKQAEKDKAGKE